MTQGPGVKAGEHALLHRSKAALASFRCLGPGEHLTTASPPSADAQHGVPGWGAWATGARGPPATALGCHMVVRVPDSPPSGGTDLRHHPAAIIVSSTQAGEGGLGYYLTGPLRG